MYSNNFINNIDNYMNNNFIAAIIKGNLEKVKFICGLNNRFNKNEALMMAVTYGQLNIVNFFCEYYFIKDIDLNLYMLTIINIAEDRKHFKVLEYLIDFYSKNIKNIIIHNKNNYDELLNIKKTFSKYLLKSVQYSSVDVIKHLYKLPLIYSIDSNFNNVSLKKATVRGNIDIFKYFFELFLQKNNSKKIPKYTMRKICKIAAIHGHNDIIKFLLEFLNCKENKKNDIQIVLIILKEIASRPFVENRISHIECYDLIKYLLDNNLQKISIENLLEIRNKIDCKINHLNYDKNKYNLFAEYINKAINLQMIVLCSVLVKKCVAIEGVGYNIATYLYKEKSSTMKNSQILSYMRDKINAKNIEHANVENIEEKNNKNNYKIRVN